MKTTHTITTALVATLAAATACTEGPTGARNAGTRPDIWPDYVGVTIPRSIAPLNFALKSDDATLIEATASAPDGFSIKALGEEANFDLDEWRDLLNHCPGGDSIMVRVVGKHADGWRAYDPFGICVSGDSLAANHLTYRRIRPGYEIWSHIGIYQRDLTSFGETPIIENTEVPNTCMNCHSARQCSADEYLFHVRGKDGGTLLVRNGKMEALNTATPQTIGSVTYPAWHPDGRYIAFSANTTRQSFHQATDKRLEVFDVASDIVMYDTETHNLILTPLLNKTDSCWETFPCFGADGKELYFCAAAPKRMPVEVRDMKYSIKKIAFDAANGQWGDTIVDVFGIDSLTTTLPRISPDGRHLMFTTCNYGTFPIWHKEADLWILDLQTGKAHPLAGLNSDDTESFHNWSPDSRWVVFSSRRDDGLFTRLYIAHISPDGRASKPFLLPQESPKEYYGRMMDSYNVPDFSVAEVKLDAKRAANMMMSEERTQVKGE